MKVLSKSIFLISSIVLFACTPHEIATDSTKSTKVESVKIDQNNMTLEIGESVSLTATILPPTADNKDVRWSSSNDDIALVSGNGKVRALSIGEAIITAECRGEQDFIVITVVASSVPITGLKLSPSNLSLKEGNSQQITVEITPENATGVNISWSSSNQAVATVDNKGLVSAIAIGEAWVIAKCQNVEEKCKVVVGPKDITLESILVSPSNLTLNIGEFFSLSISFNPDNATLKQISWTSSDERIAIVSKEGEVEAKNSGTAIITARHENLTSTCKITVNALANNEIIYTTSDNNALTNSELSQEFANNIKSNTYSGKQGKIVLKSNISKIEREAFSDCDRLTSIILPNGITTIGEAAFKSCNYLKSVSLPSNLVVIDKYAFSSTGLIDVLVPDSVTTINSFAFSGCTSLKSVKLPNQLKTLGAGAFNLCGLLTSLTIPNSVTSIESYTFGYCNSLVSITLPSSLLSIGDFAFVYSRKITSLTLPDRLQSIGQFAFDCSISSINIPASVTSFGKGAFSLCNKLTSFESPNASSDKRCIIINKEVLAFAQGDLIEYSIPNNITRIGVGAFYSCNLKGIILPETILEIGEKAFKECSQLKSVTIPSRVQLIENDAFEDCKGLTSITVKAISPPTLKNNYVFSNTGSCPIYVPKASVNAYKNDSGWKNYSSRIQAME